MSTLKVDTIQGKTSAGTVAMPAGHVVQTVLHEYQTYTEIASDSNTDVGGSSFSFTQKFSSSLLIISTVTHVNWGRSSASGQGCTVNIHFDGSLLKTSAQDYENYQRASSGGDHFFYSRVMKEHSTTISNTNAKTIKLQARPFATGDSGRMAVNYGSDSNFYSTIKVQEIAQ